VLRGCRPIGDSAIIKQPAPHCYWQTQTLAIQDNDTFRVFLPALKSSVGN